MSGSSELALDLAIMETYNARVLAVIDVSNYPPGFSVQNPFLEITPPGFAKQVLSFIPRQLNIYNSHSLQLSAAELPAFSLPDGIWKVRYSIMPNYQRFTEMTLLRLDQIKERFDSAFLKLDLSSCDLQVQSRLKKQLDMIEIYLQAGMAAAGRCNDKLAMDYYRKAQKMLDKLECSL